MVFFSSRLGHSLRVLGILLCFLMQVFTPFFVSYAAAPSLVVSDTIAGYPAFLRATGLPANTRLLAQLEKADKTILPLPITSLQDGTLTYTINDFHTQKAGKYAVKIQSEQQEDTIVDAQFTVFPDKPSSTHSKVILDRDTVVADGTSLVQVIIQLQDEYENPIKNHSIQVVSSRSTDLIRAKVKGGLTDEFGKIEFIFTSTLEGMSTLTATDLTLNEVLENRATIISQKTKNIVPSTSMVATTPLTSSLLGTAFQQQVTSEPVKSSAVTSSIKTIKITPTKTQVEVGERFGVTVEVLDQDGKPALDYRGTIQFQLVGLDGQPIALVDGTLPALNNDNKYVFDGTEQGIKRFDKTIVFNGSGSKTIRVRDMEKSTLTDQVTVIVGQGVSTPVEKITLTTPTSSSVQPTKEILIMGQTSAFMKLKIYNNGVEVSQADADKSGAFKVTLNNLPDGSHRLQVKGYDPLGNQLAQSDEIPFTVRATPAWVNKITFIPSSDVFFPGQEIHVSIESEPELRSAKLILDGGMEYTLQADPILKGTYFTTILAPQLPGVYSFKAKIENKFALPSEVPLTQSITVKDFPFAMSSLKFQVTDGSTMRVGWERPQDASAITGYAVRYGKVGESLSKKEQVGSTQGHILIKDLDPDQTYQFQFEIIGASDAILKKSQLYTEKIPATFAFSQVDAQPAQGRISLHWAVVGPTDMMKKVRILYGVAPDTYTKETIVDVTTTEVDLLPLAEGQMHYIRLQAYGQNDAVIIQSDEVTTTPLLGDNSGTGGPSTGCSIGDVRGLRVFIKDGQRYLKWTAQEGVQAYYVYRSTYPSRFDEVPEKVFSTEYQLPDLDFEHQKYYFAVMVGVEECEGATPDFSKAARVSTGPAVLWVLTGAGGIAYLRQRIRRKML